MNELIGVITVVILGNMSLVAFFLVLKALFPGRLARTRQVAGAMPGRALIVGLVNFLFFGAVGLSLFALGQQLGAPVLLIPALLVIAVLAVTLSFGLAGMAQLVGERLIPQPDGDPPSGIPWTGHRQNIELRRSIWGTLALSFACLLPLVGWFGLLPYSGMLGFGALIISFFRYTDRPG